MFAAYAFDDGLEDGIPIATGRTRDAALGLGAQRVLMLCAAKKLSPLTSRIDVQSVELSENDFAKFGDIVDTFFTERGLA